MSDLKDHFEFVNTINKEYHVMNKKKQVFDLPKGVSSMNATYTSSLNGTSSSGTSYQIYLSQDQILSDRFVEEISFDVTINVTATAAGGYSPWVVQGVATPRMMPIESATATSSITLNGTTIQINSQDVLAALMAFNVEPTYAGRDIPCSSLDVFADLPAVPGAAQAQAALKNPSLDYFSSTFGTPGRLSEVLYTIAAASLQNSADGNPRNCTATVVVRQPFFTGITSLVDRDIGGFMGITNCQLNRTFVNNLGPRLYEVLAGYTGGNACVVNGVTAVITPGTVPRLYYTTFNPPSNYRVEYPIFCHALDYGTQSQQAGTVTGTGLTANIASQTISLSSVPRCIYVWCAIPNALKNTAAFTDAPGFKITSIAMNLNGVSGQFASLQEYEIYDIFSLKQGYYKLYAETDFLQTPIGANAGGANALISVGGYGSVLRIDASQLGGIDWDQYSVGSQISMNLQINVTCKNLHAANATPSLFIQVVNDNLLEITGPSSATLYRSILSPSEVEELRKSAPTEFTHDVLVAGSFFGKLWDGIKDTGKYLWDHKGDIANVAKTVAPLVGLGKHQKPMHHKGGAKVTKAALQKRLKGHGVAFDESEDEYDY